MTEPYDVHRDVFGDLRIRIDSYTGITASDTFWITILNGSRLTHVVTASPPTYPSSYRHVLPLEFLD